jgi:hypothetical protein
MEEECAIRMRVQFTPSSEWIPERDHPDFAQERPIRSNSLLLLIAHAEHTEHHSLVRQHARRVHRTPLTAVL